MSWIGVMIGVGVGAAAGGIQAGVNGGDAEDILTGMAIGGGIGGVTGGAGSALSGPAGGAAGGAAAGDTAESGAASTVGSSLTPTASGITTDVGADAATTSATTGTTGTLGSGGLNALNSSFTGGSLGVDTTPTLFQGANAANAANLGFGQGALNTGLNAVNITNPVAQNMIYGGLKGAAIGAGVGGLGSALTGQDIGKGMEGGALTGAIGGIGGAGLSGLTGSSNATLSDIGDFATKHDTLVPAGISLAATPFVNKALSSTSSIPTDTGPSYKTNIHWAGPTPGTFNQASFTPDLPNPTDYYPTSQGYADGGIAHFVKGGDVPKYTPAGLPEGLPEGLPTKIQHFSPKAPMTGPRPAHPIEMAHGGIANLGSYRSGGSPNLLQGPGDGTSDSIPASIGGKQPARLASGEYVVSSRIVSELGNGSTDAGAKRLDEMVKRIQSDRKKTTGKNKEYAKDTKAYRHLPA